MLCTRHVRIPEMSQPRPENTNPLLPFLSHVRIAHTSRSSKSSPVNSIHHGTITFKMLRIHRSPARLAEPVLPWLVSRIAAEVDIHRLATIGLCNVPRHDEDKWMRQNFQRTNLARLTDDLNSLIIKIQARIIDPRYIVAVVYDESTDPETEWGQANMCKPLRPAVGNIVPGSRPLSKGDLTIVGFIVVERSHWTQTWAQTWTWTWIHLPVGPLRSHVEDNEPCVSILTLAPIAGGAN